MFFLEACLKLDCAMRSGIKEQSRTWKVKFGEMRCELLIHFTRVKAHALGRYKHCCPGYSPHLFVFALLLLFPFSSSFCMLFLRDFQKWAHKEHFYFHLIIWFSAYISTFFPFLFTWPIFYERFSFSENIAKDCYLWQLSFEKMHLKLAPFSPVLHQSVHIFLFVFHPCYYRRRQLKFPKINIHIKALKLMRLRSFCSLTPSSTKWTPKFGYLCCNSLISKPSNTQFTP